MPTLGQESTARAPRSCCPLRRTSERLLPKPLTSSREGSGTQRAPGPRRRSQQQGELPRACGKRRETEAAPYLSAQPAVVRPVEASLVQLVADHRLWQSLQEDEECFSHRVVTARWIGGNQGAC